MRLFAFGFLVLASPFAFAQTTQERDPIGTVRPRITDTARIVPVGALQLEAGLTFGFGGESINRRDDYGELLLRYGIAPRLEARLELPTYTDWHPLNFLDGFGDVSISVSYLLGRLGPASFALRPRLTLPTGPDYPHVDEVSPSVFLTGESPLGKGWSIASTVGYSHVRYDVGVLFFGSGEFRYDVYHATLAVERALRGRASVFAEYAGDYVNGVYPNHVVNVGARLRLGGRSQVDVHLALPIGDSDRQNGLGVGYAVRF